MADGHDDAPRQRVNSAVQENVASCAFHFNSETNQTDKTMSDAGAGNTTLIHSIDDVIAPFLQGNDDCKAGIELELTFLKRDNAALRPINDQENKQLQAILLNPQDHGYNFAPVPMSEEAATMTLEIKTDAANLDNFEDILNDLDRQIAAVQKVCAALDIEICPYAQAPDVPMSELFNLVVSRDSDRAEAFINAFRDNGFESYYKNFFLNNAVQTSVSYKNPDHLRRNLLRLTFLTAPLSTVHDNSSGRIEGAPDPQQTGLRLREGLADGNRGGTPDFIFSAPDGEQLIRSYFQWIMDTPLLARCDENAAHLTAISPDLTHSFNEFATAKTKLNHQTNFELALGMVWPHLKLAYIKDNDGVITGTRFEARACDAGGWRNHSYPILVAALAMNEEYASAIDSLLADYGFDPQNPQDSRALYDDSITAALNYEDRFGNAKMTNFLQDFSVITHMHFREQPALYERLKPFMRECHSSVLHGLQRRQNQSAPNSSSVHNF